VAAFDRLRRDDGRCATWRMLGSPVSNGGASLDCMLSSAVGRRSGIP
jgi:hypothetical protein